MDRNPSVLVGAPVSDYHEYCTEDYIKAIKNLAYKNYDILLADNSRTKDFSEKLKSMGIEVVRAAWEHKDPRKRIVACRNLLRERALQGGYDYLFSLEQDVIPPSDVLERLLRHGKPVISGVYYSIYNRLSGKVLLPVLCTWLSEGNKKEIRENLEYLKRARPEFYKDLEAEGFDLGKASRQMSVKEVEGDMVIRVKVAGLGCLLVSRGVLEKVKFRENPGTGFDDEMFSKDLLALDIPLHCDTSVKCVHLVKNRPWEWDDLFREAGIVRHKD